MCMMYSTTSCHVFRSSGSSTYPSPMWRGVCASLPAVMGLPTLLASFSERLFADGIERPFLASIPSKGYARVFFTPSPDHQRYGWAANAYPPASCIRSMVSWMDLSLGIRRSIPRATMWPSAEETSSAGMIMTLPLSFRRS